MSWDSSVSIMTSYRLDDQSEDISQQLCPNKLWDPCSLLSNGYQGPFPWG